MNFAILTFDDQDGADYRFFYLEENDYDVTFDYPVGDYMIILQDLYEEKAGTLQTLHFRVEEGKTAVIHFP